MNNKFKIGDYLQHKQYKDFVFIVIALDYNKYINNHTFSYVLSNTNKNGAFSAGNIYIEHNYIKLSELGQILYINS